MFFRLAALWFVPFAAAVPQANFGRNIPIELTANKPYARVQVNGRGPYWFLLDSGASFNVLDKDRATALGISASGRRQESGAGEGTLTSGVANGVTLALSGLSIPSREIRVLAVNAAISQAEGRIVDGLLGYDLFKQFVVEIDYWKGIVNLYEPRSYAYSGDGERIPLRVLREHALVTATLILSDGRRVPGDFIVDTGWRSALTLNGPFSKVQRIWASLDKTIDAATGMGLGGPTKDTLGRINSLKLGRYLMSHPVTGLSKAQAGVSSEDGFAGIIGAEVLRRFKVVFDYSRKQMILEPNANFSEPYEFDMSGMFVMTDAERFDLIQVREVLQASPAFDAGIRPGDVIAAVDDRPAAQLGLDRVRRMFKEREGKEYLLRVRRGDRSLQFKIQLRRLI